MGTWALCSLLPAAAIFASGYLVPSMLLIQGSTEPLVAHLGAALWVRGGGP